ncbi:hypothetical protein BCR33DRAFT_793779 [Rhizoclosmatium globosum]|uniref:Uncharacterized protein n=1 Tax=Rhizoclosmatium globosum TaxID=329046 RepID=A0A1Y2AYB4_9FUNG|nr:hypothetical protein BCR33DRAFT_793779 [Rhizoclosmatium globosum]|eukprot:ORY27558.1 hypothetical protein BCR33DRAFT_793779 [Rhizoclosmatium globosum]
MLFQLTTLAIAAVSVAKASHSNEASNGAEPVAIIEGAPVVLVPPSDHETNVSPSAIFDRARQIEESGIDKASVLQSYNPAAPPIVLFNYSSPSSQGLYPGSGSVKARATSDTPLLTFYGGPLLSYPVIQPLFYGAVASQAAIQTYYNAIVQSPWMDIMQYGINTGSTKPAISVPQTINQAKGYISDADIQGYLYNLAMSGNIVPTTSTYFPIHIAVGTTVGFVRDGTLVYSCANWCSYHNAVDISDLNLGVQFIVYGVIPDHALLLNKLWSNSDKACVDHVSAITYFSYGWSGCYGSIDISHPLPAGTVSSKTNGASVHNIQLDAYGVWSDLGGCTSTLYQACFPTKMSAIESPVVGRQVVSGSKNFVWNGSSWVDLGYCVLYPTSYFEPSYWNKLIGVAPDNTLWKKDSLSAPWQSIGGSARVLDVLFALGTYVVVGIDKILYTCPIASLSIWTHSSCTQVAGSGSVLSIDILTDEKTLIGVGTDYQLYTRVGLTGSWTLVPNLGGVFVQDVSVIASLNDPWLLVPGSCCVTKASVMFDGIILGVGTDGAVYEFIVSGYWAKLPNSASVISVAPAVSWTLNVVIGIAPDNSLWGKSSDSPSDPWISIPGPRGIDVVQAFYTDASAVVVADDFTLWNCPTLEANVGCTQVPNSGSVKSVDQFSDGSFVAVGLDNQLYTRKTLNAPWIFVPQSGKVVDITVNWSDDSLIGTAPDGTLWTKKSLAIVDGWLPVPYSCCVKSTALLDNESIAGVGLDDQIYLKKNLTVPWVLWPNSGTVKAVASFDVVKSYVFSFIFFVHHY